MWYPSPSLKPPFHTCFVLLGIGVRQRADEGIEEDVDGKGLCGVREARCREVGGQVVHINVEKAGGVRKLFVQDGIRMGTRGVVVGYVTVEDEG